MRYLLDNSFSDEYFNRKSYIYDTFHLWTKRIDELPSFICLEGFPLHTLDVLVLVGHNHNISNYLESNIQNITEKTIILITCKENYTFSKYKKYNKTIYLAKQNQDKQCDLLHGEYYNFNFDLTESELLFFNNRHITNFEHRFESAFIKL